MNLAKNSLIFDHFRLSAINLGCSCIDFDIFLFAYKLGISSILAGEVLVFYLPICFFYYLAKLIIFISSSRIPCIFFLQGGSRALCKRKKFLPFLMWFQRYEFLNLPLHFMGEALGILYNQTLEYLFIR